MSDWTGGYVQNIDYTFGYYTVMNPARIRLAFLLSGLTPPPIASCCELGFGNGITVNVHAAASPCEWHGNDFNPSQLLFAADIAHKAGTTVHLCDDSFEDYARRTDLPQFDFIALHGIWTYVSAQNRATILSFINSRLKPGGVVYVSYNLMAGWAKFLPLRALMLSQQHDFKSQKTTASNPARDALAMLDRLVEVNARTFQGDPKLMSLFASLKQDNPDYIIHEFFGANWNIMNFSDTAREMEQAKLSYACSANYMDHLSSIDLTADQQNLINSASSVALKEDLRDVILHRRFRMDYWVKGSLPMNPQEQLRLLSEQRVVLWSPPDVVKSAIPELAGLSTIAPDIYHAVIDGLAGHSIQTLGAVQAGASHLPVTIIHVIHITMAMIQRGHAMVAQDEADIAASRAGAKSFNAHVMERARFGTEHAHKYGREISYLASPVTGGGVTVSRIDQLFLLATTQGVAEAGGLAEFAWGILSGLGETLEKDGTPLETPEANRAHLNERAKSFLATLLPAMKGLGIA
jgi:SAM-dependent methyltransferase